MTTYIEGPDFSIDHERGKFLADYFEVLLAKLAEQQPCQIKEIEVIQVIDNRLPDTNIFFVRLTLEKPA